MIIASDPETLDPPAVKLQCQLIGLPRNQADNMRRAASLYAPAVRRTCGQYAVLGLTECVALPHAGVRQPPGAGVPGIARLGIGPFAEFTLRDEGLESKDWRLEIGHRCRNQNLGWNVIRLEVRIRQTGHS